MKRRLCKTFISILLVTALFVCAMPVSAASVSTNYNTLVSHINEYGEMDENGYKTLGFYITAEGGTVYFFLRNHSSGVQFQVIAVGSESEGNDVDLSFILQKYTNTLSVKFHTVYYSDNTFVDEVETTKSVNRTTLTAESEYTVSGSTYITAEDASTEFTGALQLLCLFWHTYFQEAFGFGLKDLGFTSYCFHQYNNNCDPNCNLCGTVREPPHDYTGWRSCGDDEHQNHCSTCYNYAYEPHDWVASNPQLPTCQQDGYQWFTCSACGAMKKDTFPKGDEHHDYSDWQKLDEENHERTCQICAEKETAPHSWDSGKLTQMPTEDALGIITYTCTDCGAVKTAEVDYIPGDIDANGVVNRDDVIQLLLYVSMPEAFPITIPADYTGDGLVTRDDVIQLLLHVSMPDAFPLQ